MRSFNLKFIDDLGDDLADCLILLNDLEEISLVHTGITDIGVGKIIGKFSQLKKIDVSHASITSNSLSNIGNCPYLENLNVSWNDQITDEALKTLPSSTKFLGNFSNDRNFQVLKSLIYRIVII